MPAWGSRSDRAGSICFKIARLRVSWLEGVEFRGDQRVNAPYAQHRRVRARIGRRPERPCRICVTKSPGSAKMSRAFRRSGCEGRLL